MRYQPRENVTSIGKRSREKFFNNRGEYRTFANTSTQIHDDQFELSRGLFELIKAADATELNSEPDSLFDAFSSEEHPSSDSESSGGLQSLDFCRLASGAEDEFDASCNGRKCSVSDCFKFPQSRTPFCIAHGGGRRCTVLNCTKAARDRLLCAAHGGGRRCDKPDCDKSAVGGSSTCSSHGGGKKCAWHSGCPKAAQSPTTFCVTHGGGRRCTMDRCSKVARGKTLFCSSHGGGARCCVEFCGRASLARSKNCRMHTSSRSKGATSFASSSDA